MCNVTPSNQFDRKSFSPIIVRESPVKKIAQSGNLTGEPRRARDLAAELHALTQKWQVLHLEGLHQLTAMAPNIQLHGEGLYDRSMLQDQCDSLADVYISLCAVVTGMETVAKQYRSLQSLAKAGSEPMFLTWSPAKFSEVATSLAQAHRAELEAKRRVKESVAHSPSKAVMTYYMALWMHQVYIEPGVQLGLESLLLETGLRTTT